jgi:O-antigen/teichoic acid export membrane protein
VNLSEPRRWRATDRLLADVLARSAFFLLTVLAARRLDPSAFGLFAVAATAGWLCGVVTDAGLQMHVARLVARVEPADAHRVLDRWISWRLGAAALGIVVAAGWNVSVAATFADALAAVLIVCAGVAAALTEFYGHLFRGLSRADLESAILVASRAAALALGGAMLLWHPTLLALAGVLLVVNAGTTAAAALTAVRLAPNGPGGAAVHEGRWREFVGDALPIGIGVVLSALYFRIDLFLLERWQNADIAGAYNAVFRLVEALRLVPAAAIAVALPALFRADTLHVARRLGIRLTGVAGLVSLWLWVIADWLIPFCFGRSFAYAVPAFRIQVAAFPLMALNSVLTTQLVAWHRHGVFAALCGVALIFNVSLNRVLIPSRSLDGAAWATWWTEALLTLGCVAVFAGVRARQVASLTTVPR